MTFTLGATGARSVYLTVDHRITWSDRFEDRGVKAAWVRAVDGVALVGYAGLGETAKGSQPSTWIYQLLHGRKFTVEGCVAELAIGIGQEFPPHMLDLGGDHLVVVPAVVESKPRMYGVHLRDGSVGYAPLRQRHLVESGASDDTPPRAIYTGNGGAWFARQNDKATRLREIYSLIGDHDSGRISGEAVASALARLNGYVGRHIAGVSPACTVTWAEKDTSGAWHLGNQTFDDVGQALGSSFADPVEVCADGDGDDSLPLEFPGIQSDIDGRLIRKGPNLQ